MQKRIETAGDARLGAPVPWRDRILELAIDRMHAPAWLVDPISAEIVARNDSASSSGSVRRAPTSWTTSAWTHLADALRTAPQETRTLKLETHGEQYNVRRLLGAGSVLVALEVAPYSGALVTFVGDSIGYEAKTPARSNLGSVRRTLAASRDQTAVPDRATAQPKPRKLAANLQDRATLADIASRIQQRTPTNALLVDDDTQPAPAAHDATEPTPEMNGITAELAHELRTPIGAIRTLVDVIREQDERSNISTTGGLTRNLDDIAKSADHALSILARLSGQLKSGDESADGDGLQPYAFSTNSLIAESVSALTPSALNVGVALSANVPNADIVLINADRTEVRQALDNLVVNAIRHTGAGGRVEVTCRTVFGSATGEADVQIEVRDTGAGMLIDTVGMPQSTPATPKGERGSQGLGLKIVRRIAADHGGSFRLFSRIGHGTRACLRLPQSRKPLSAEPRG